MNTVTRETAEMLVQGLAGAERDGDEGAAVGYRRAAVDLGIAVEAGRHGYVWRLRSGIDTDKAPIIE